MKNNDSNKLTDLYNNKVPKPNFNHINMIKVIEINDGEVTDVIDMKVSDEVWNDKLELWYEYNKRYDDVGKEGVLDGWKVSRLGNVMVVNDKDGYEMVVFMRN